MSLCEQFCDKMHVIDFLSENCGTPKDLISPKIKNLFLCRAFKSNIKPYLTLENQWQTNIYFGQTTKLSC